MHELLVFQAGREACGMRINSIARWNRNGPHSLAFSKHQALPDVLLPVLGEKVAKPDEGEIELKTPHPNPLPEYRERAVIRSSPMIGA
jgi:hypothetical protein